MKKLKLILVRLLEDLTREEPPEVPLAQSKRIVEILQRDYSVPDQTIIVRTIIEELLAKRKENKTTLEHEIENRINQLRELDLHIELTQKFLKHS